MDIETSSGRFKLKNNRRCKVAMEEIDRQSRQPTRKHISGSRPRGRGSRASSLVITQTRRSSRKHYAGEDSVFRDFCEVVTPDPNYDGRLCPGVAHQSMGGPVNWTRCCSHIFQRGTTHRQVDAETNPAVRQLEKLKIRAHQRVASALANERVKACSRPDD